LIEITWQMEPT